MRMARRRLTSLACRPLRPLVAWMYLSHPGRRGAQQPVSQTPLDPVRRPRAVGAVQGYVRSQEGLRLQATSDALMGLDSRPHLVTRVNALVPRAEAAGGHVDLLFLDIDAFRWPLIVDENSLVNTVSVGLARSTGPATAEGLLRDADTAMHRAKDAGRNRCVMFDSSMRESVRARVETELALRHALDRRQMVLHYQPTARARPGQSCGGRAPAPRRTSAPAHA